MLSDTKLVCHAPKRCQPLRFVPQRMLSGTKLVYHGAKAVVIWCFMRQPVKLPMAKKKPASQKTPASMICTAMHAVGHDIDLSWGESRRDMVFLGQQVELPMAKKDALPNDNAPFDLSDGKIILRLTSYMELHQVQM